MGGGEPKASPARRVLPPKPYAPVFPPPLEPEAPAAAVDQATTQDLVAPERRQTVHPVAFAVAGEYPPLRVEEPKPPTTQAAGKKEPPTKASASLASTGAGQRGLPILFDNDKNNDKDSFLEREMKFARRWLYSKGVMVPEEDRNPVDVELDSFMESVRTGKRPLADLEVGLADSTAVMLANHAMDEGRRVYFHEIDKMGRGDPKKKA